MKNSWPTSQGGWSPFLLNESEEAHAHRFGIYLVINITIGLEGSLTMAAGDEIASKAEKKLLNEIAFLRRVHVHYHPAKEGAISKSWPPSRAAVLKIGEIGEREGS